MAAVYRALVAQNAPPHLAVAAAQGKIAITPSALKSPDGRTLVNLPETAQAYAQRMDAERLFDRELWLRKRANLPSGLQSREV
jgi:hypothetical protein